MTLEQKQAAEMYFPIELRPSKFGWVFFPATDEYIGASFRTMGEYSPMEVAFLRAILQPGATVINCGANIGSLMLPIADAVGDNGQVLCFEPQWFMFRLLEANINANDLGGIVKAQYAAVGAQPGTLHIPIYDYRKSNNYSGIGKTEWEGNTEGLEVPLITIDSLGLERLDLLQADVEKMEKEVLQGAAKTLERFRPRLFVENTHEETSDELIEYVREIGYIPYWVITQIFTGNNYFGQADPTWNQAVCTFNMYCVPLGRPEWQVAGLREAKVGDPVGNVPGEWIITGIGQG